MSSVDKLQKRVESNREMRESVDRLDKHIHAREILVTEAPDQQDMDFFCEVCGTHASSIGKKRIRYGLNIDTGEDYRVEPISALFVGQCKKGHRVERFITDKERDPYFQSPILRRLAYEMQDDMLQPSDPRFAKVYPEAWKKLNEVGHEVGPHG